MGSSLNTRFHMGPAGLQKRVNVRRQVRSLMMAAMIGFICPPSLMTTLAISAGRLTRRLIRLRSSSTRTSLLLLLR